MTARLKLVLSTLCCAVFSCLYWFVVWNLAYGLTGGDYRPGVAAPSTGELNLRLWTILSAAFVIYAAVMWFWRAMDFRIQDRSAG